MATLSRWCTNQGLLFATRWSFLSLLSKKLENIAASRRVLQDVLRTNFFVFRLHQALQRLHVHFDVGTSHQVIFHCPVTFPMSSTQHAALLGPPATVFHSTKKTNFDATALSHTPSKSGFPTRTALLSFKRRIRILQWCGRRHSSSSRRVRFHW